MWTIVSFVFFTGLVGGITWLLTKGDKHDTSDGYFLGGRSLTAGFIAGSLLLTNLSTEQLVGLNGAAFTDGLSVIAWEVIAGMSLVLMALFFLPKYLKSGITTVPEYLEKRFDHNTRFITSWIFVIAYIGILLPIVLYTGAKGLVGILDLETMTGLTEVSLIWIVVWFVGILGSIYAIFGGLRTVAVSDTINGFGLLVGGILIAYLGLKAVSPDGVFDALSTLQEKHPEKFNSLGGPTQSVPFYTIFTGVLLINMFYWCTNQQIIQRTFGATSLAEGQKGVLLAGGFKILAPIILVLPGLIAYHLYHDVEGFKADDAYGTLVRKVLPDYLTGFFAAVVIGAILSSFNSALNSTATLFSLGIYSKMNQGASDRQVIAAGKIFGVIVALLSMFAAPFLLGQDNIFGYLQKMNALYFIPIFAVVVVGMLTKKVPSLPANISLVVGCCIIALGYFVPGFDKALSDAGINGFHFVAIVFVLLVAGMLIWGAIAPGRVVELEDTKDVELTPWKYALPVGLSMVVVVVVIYAYFADFSVVSG